MASCTTKCSAAEPTDETAEAKANGTPVGVRARSLLVFADDWGRHPSSCQHLVRRLRERFPVLWANTIGTRRPTASALTVRRVVEKLKNWSKGVEQVDRQMWTIDLPMLPSVGGRIVQAINRRLVSRRLRRTIAELGLGDVTVLTTLPYVDWMIRGVARRGLVYYCTDDYSHWPGADRDALVAADAAITRQADLVLAVSQALLSSHGQARRCEYFPHGVDFEHFGSAQSGAAPADELLALPGPRIGFFGLIYEKLDFELLSAVARRFPNGTVAMIGPVDFCDPAFAALPNVRLLGKRDYADLPRWIAGLDVLLLPYVDDEMIRQSGPLKLRECLASGKPTVSVDVPEVRPFQPHVRIGRTIDEFVAQVETAVNESHDLRQIAARQSRVRDDSWDRRAEQLMHYLSEL